MIRDPYGVDFSEEDIRQRLNREAHAPLPDGFAFPDRGVLRDAAVLVPLFRQDEKWHVLFTRRADTLRDHKGQVAFPGGSMEPQDGGPLETALREASEEIGLNPQDVRVLGNLSTIVTGTGYRITPIVGVIPWPYPLIPSVQEVSRIFSIPLDWLAQPSQWEKRWYQRSAKDDLAVQVISFHEYAGETLWGVSAAMIVQLLSVLGLERQPDQS